MAHADCDKMFDYVRGVIKGRCHFCDSVLEDGSVVEKVKVPGYVGKHRKKFCSEEHLKSWKEFVEAWEKENYEIPETNKGPTCVNCMR